MKKFIKSSLSNPKVRLALCVLLSVILAIGFFGDSNLPGVADGATKAATSGVAAAGATNAATSGVAAAATPGVAAAASSKYLLATLSPMVMGFTVIPFILSVLGIGISGYQTYKQHKKEKKEKITNTYNNIKKEKDELNKEYKKLEKEIEDKITDTGGKGYRQAVNNFICNKEIKLEDLSAVLSQDGNRLSYTSIITFFLINNEVDRLREIKAEIVALSVIEGKDLSKIELKEISKDTSPKDFPDPRAKYAVITKLMVGEKGKGR